MFFFFDIENFARKKSPEKIENLLPLKLYKIEGTKDTISCDGIGIQAVVNECANFVNCYNGSGVIQSCAPGTYFHKACIKAKIDDYNLKNANESLNYPNLTLPNHINFKRLVEFNLSSDFTWRRIGKKEIDKISPIF